MVVVVVGLSVIVVVVLEEVLKLEVFDALVVLVDKEDDMSFVAELEDVETVVKGLELLKVFVEDEVATTVEENELVKLLVVETVLEAASDVD